MDPLAVTPRRDAGLHSPVSRIDLRPDRYHFMMMGLFEFRRRLEYKAAMRGGLVVVAIFGLLLLLGVIGWLKRMFSG